MASHLSVMTATAGVPSSKSLNGPAGADPADSGRDVFAALLDTAGNRPEPTPAAAPESSTANRATSALGFGEDAPDDAQDPEAIAALLDAALTTPPPTEAAALSGLIDDLAALKARLAAGEPLDAAALQRLDAALSDLAKALGLDLTALPSAPPATPGDATSFATQLAAQLAAALAPLAETLLGRAATAGADDALAAQLTALSDKLTAMLAALNSDPAALAPFADAELEAALARLTNPPVTLPTAEPVLAAPTLKLTEPVLAGKSSADATPADDTTTFAAAAKAAASGDAGTTGSGADARSDDKKSGDARATPLAATIDTPEILSSAQPGQLARVDAVAAPRVVQPGYQTSQQQLNLPQLAFELVRQVTDGNTRFQIRLNPSELGRIDVRLDIDASGQVNARLTVEKAETLDLMQRDQRGLEKALQQAGLDGAKTNLEFSLKQNPFSGGQSGQDGHGRPSLFGDEAAEAEAPLPTINLYRGSLSASGVNIIA